MDNFDGFELLNRFHAPETGEVFVTFKADSHLAISQHFGVWKAKFGLDWYITAVLNDDEVSQRNKQVADSVASMGQYDWFRVDLKYGAISFFFVFWKYCFIQNNYPSFGECELWFNKPNPHYLISKMLRVKF